MVIYQCYLQGDSLQLLSKIHVVVKSPGDLTFQLCCRDGYDLAGGISRVLVVLPGRTF